jgi:hypothetical protein
MPEKHQLNNMETRYMKTIKSQLDLGTDDITESPPADKGDVDLQEVATPNSKLTTLKSPSKRVSDDILDSPSIGKNKAMKQEGIRQFAMKFNSLEN